MWKSQRSIKTVFWERFGKYEFVVLCAVDNVGAAIGRPRREMLRIRIGFRRIRDIVPSGG